MLEKHKFKKRLSNSGTSKFSCRFFPKVVKLHLAIAFDNCFNKAENVNTLNCTAIHVFLQLPKHFCEVKIL